MALLLITHDLGIVAQMADRVAVMYAGEIVELAERESFFRAPQHPYSQKLFAALPTPQRRAGELAVIRGQVPPLTRTFNYCRFAERCDYVFDRCRVEAPALLEPLPRHRARWIALQHPCECLPCLFRRAQLLQNDSCILPRVGVVWLNLDRPAK